MTAVIMMNSSKMKQQEKSKQFITLQKLYIYGVNLDFIFRVELNDTV